MAGIVVGQNGSTGFAVGQIWRCRNGRKARILATGVICRKSLVVAIEAFEGKAHEVVDTLLPDGRFSLVQPAGTDLMELITK